MTLIRFIWIPLYILAALIHHFTFGDHALESLINVLPAFIVGLIPAVLVFILFMRSKWSWYHVMNLGAGIMVVWVFVNANV